ncbi:MAG: DMT family transporter [archaeon]|jgi:drug/metabolite transporter (DMT)-like permease
MKAYIYMIFAALCLATIGVLVKLVGTAVPILSLSFIRTFIAFIFLLAITPIANKGFMKVNPKKLPKFLGIGIVYAISMVLFNMANLHTTIQNAVLLHYIYPFFVLFFAYFLLKEKITKTKAITLVIALCGMAVINPLDVSTNILGNLLALLGAVFFAILITEMRSVDKEHCPGSIVWFVFFAALALLPFAAIYGFGDWQSVWPYLVLLGVISTGLAYMLYNLALENMEAENASIIAMIITPVVSISLAFFILAEQVQIQTIVGGLLLIIAGVYLETHSKNIKQEEAFIEKVQAVTEDAKNKNPNKLGEVIKNKK